MTHKGAAQALEELRKLLKSDDLERMSEKELKGLMTELTIVTHEISKKVEQRTGRPAVRARAEPDSQGRPIGILSRIINSWTNDIDNLPGLK